MVKKRHTVKKTVIATSSRFILFLGKTVWGGRYHDFTLLKEEFNKGDAFGEHQVWVDLAYVGCYFKTELLEDGAFLSLEDARTEIFEFIELYHNPIRRHSSLGYKSPLNFEKIYYQNHSLNLQ